MDSDHDKIIRTEEKVDALSNIVSEIKDNHLVHLSRDIAELKSAISVIDKKIAMWSGGIGAIIYLVDKFIK